MEPISHPCALGVPGNPADLPRLAALPFYLHDGPMPRLENQRTVRSARNLPFCYVCGRNFTDDDLTDHDHVPAEAVFANEHRQPLKLRTHRSCNHDNKLVDEKIGQMIALPRGQSPRPEHRRLIAMKTKLGTAILNLDVDGAVWRWIAGFHASLRVSRSVQSLRPPSPTTTSS